MCARAGSRNVPKTAKINVASSRMFAIVGGTRLSARMTRVITDKARSVRMNRYAAPCDDGREVMDTMMDGIDNTRVAIRKPYVMFSELAMEAGARGDAVITTRGSMSNAASMAENMFSSSNDLIFAFLDAEGTDGLPATKEADKGTVMAEVHAKVRLLISFHSSPRRKRLGFDGKSWFVPYGRDTAIIHAMNEATERAVAHTMDSAASDLGRESTNTRIDNRIEILRRE